MDLRRPVIIRADRLRSRVEARLPAFLKGALSAELESVLERPLPKQEFACSIDRVQRRLYEHLLRAYRHEPFCRLFALKLSNLAVAKYHFLNRHVALASLPLQLTVDPANACQLACPACVHTSNREYAALFDWPASMLAVDAYESFVERAGALAFCASLYNYGEPLLHKRFPDFVRSSKKYLLFTTTSTNLSMPLADTDDIVASGLDRMILSIDGVTQDAYERYRRKGRLDLVFENVRRLVASKKKLGSRTPYLVWQFLTFEHNVHQVPEAIRKARELGVNEILVQTPFEVTIDDAGIRAAPSAHRGTHKFAAWDGNWCSEDRRIAVAELSSKIETLFENTWEQRFESVSHGDEDDTPGGRTCDWLYQNLTIDGAARVMPCCMAPAKGHKHVVFANFARENGGSELVNTAMAKLARLAFRDRPAYEAEIRYLAPENRPYCAQCTENPALYGLANVAGDIRALDEKSTLPRHVRWLLTRWARPQS